MTEQPKEYIGSGLQGLFCYFCFGDLSWYQDTSSHWYTMIDGKKACYECTRERQKEHETVYNNLRR